MPLSGRGARSSGKSENVRRSDERSRVKHSLDSMGRICANTKARVVWMWRAGFSVIKIRERLLEEGIKISRKSLYFLLKK